AVLLRDDRDGVLREERRPDRDPVARLHFHPGQAVPLGEDVLAAPDLIGAVDREAHLGIAETAAEADLDQGGRVSCREAAVLYRPAGAAGAEGEREPEDDRGGGDVEQRISEHGPSLSGNSTQAPAGKQRASGIGLRDAGPAD